jgi:hypothetical protein
VKTNNVIDEAEPESSCGALAQTPALPARRDPSRVERDIGPTKIKKILIGREVGFTSSGFLNLLSFGAADALNLGGLLRAPGDQVSELWCRSSPLPGVCREAHCQGEF